jgi:energy-coupling factor transport system permease protein
VIRSPLVYVPRRAPLQLASPAAASAFLASFIVVAFLFSNPIVLCGAVAAAALTGELAGARRAVAASLRAGLALVLLIVAVNGLVTDRGETVLVRLGDWPLLGPVNVTAEALGVGGVIGLRILVALVAFGVYSACVDPDRVLRALRPFAGRSALTATLISRLVPVAARDAVRLREAAALRGPAAAPAGRGPLARRLLAGSLDRAVDVAATLELRGYGLPPTKVERRRDRSRHDRRFFAAAALIATGALLARLAGVGGFEGYPTLQVAADPATWALTIGVPAAAAASFTRMRPRRRLAPGRARPAEAIRVP